MLGKHAPCTIINMSQKKHINYCIPVEETQSTYCRLIAIGIRGSYARLMCYSWTSVRTTAGRIMDSLVLITVCASIVIVSTVSAAQEGAICQACNCQFNNVEALSRLIQSKIAAGGQCMQYSQTIGGGTRENYR